jgi:DsbC/DsbD-like thiol-disulfide interchange protein
MSNRRQVLDSWMGADTTRDRDDSGRGRRRPGRRRRGAVSRALLVAALGGLGAAAGRPAAAAASDWAVNPQSQVRLITAYRVAPRQGELRLGIQFRLPPNWHVYWKNSGDAGFAPVVAFGRVPGLSYPEMQWPAPHRFELAGGLEAFGYEGEAVYPVRATLATSASQVRLTADVDYLVCQVDCVPHRYTLALDQPLADTAQPDPATSPLLDRWFAQVPLPADRQPGVAATGSISGQQLQVRLDGVSAAGGGADIFFEPQSTFQVGRPRVRSTPQGLIFDVPLTRTDSSAPPPRTATLAWAATGLMQGGRPLALSASQQLAIQPPASPALAAAAPSGAAAAPTGAPAAASGVAATQPDAAATPAGAAMDGPRAKLAAFDPRLVAAAAAIAALMALALWGLLRAPTFAAASPASPPAAPHGAPAIGRVALGFVALLLALGLLYTLSLEVSAERLAGVELALLGMALLIWLRRRGAFRMRRSQP